MPDENRLEYAEAIESEARNMATMSDSLLKLTRLESQQLLPPKKMFALDEQIRQVAGTLYPAIERKRIELRLELMDIQVRANEDLMRQVWQNLLSNAIKFTHEGGEIEVQIGADRQYVRVVVEDNGIGMDEQTQRRIFEKFYQADRSHHSGGHGLGLALVKHIVELSGGSVGVRSSPGKGSRFCIALPR